MSVLGHVAIGLVAARRLRATGDQGNLSRRMLAFSALALLPDIDLLLGAIAPSLPLLAHRGATHSIVFAIGVGGAISLAIRARGRARAAAWGLLAGALVMSHALMDSVGDSPVGVALLWPFSNARFLGPWHVLPNPTLEMFSSGDLSTLVLEFVIFLPVWLYAFRPRRWSDPGARG